MKSFAQEMAFYSAYHQERRNVLIHVVGVPTITFSLLTLMSLWNLYTFENGFALTFAMIFLAATLLYYFYLDLTFGLVSTIVYGGLAVGAHYVALQGTTPALVVFGAGQLLGWGTQIYGHAAFEGNRPAFLDNLFQALFSAPLFVTTLPRRRPLQSYWLVWTVRLEDLLTTSTRRLRGS